MHKLLGGIGFTFGLVALGIWAWVEHAPRIVARLSAQAAVVIEDARHGVSVQVAGRDLVVTGILDGVAERDQMVASLARITGIRSVQVNALVLPTISPFDLSVQRRDGQNIWRGHVPSEVARARIASRIGQPAADALSLSAGAPDTEWSAMALQGASALAHLVSGRFELSDRVGMLQGVARSPREAAQAEAALAILPEGYSVRTEFTLMDDGTPFSARIEKAGNMAHLVGGKLPKGVTLADLRQSLGLPLDGSAPQAAIAPLNGDWVEALNSGLMALSHLDNGIYDITGRTMVIEGQAITSDALARAEASLAVLPEGFTAETRISQLPRPAFTALSVQKAPNGMTAQGTLPFGLVAQDLPVLDPSDLHEAGTDRDPILWRNAAQQTLAAMDLLRSGTARLTATDLTLEGEAKTGEALLHLRVITALLARDLSVAESVTLPPPLQILWRFDAIRAGSASADLPLTVETVLKPFLPLFDAAILLANAEGGMHLLGQVPPSHDVARLRAALQRALKGSGVGLTLIPLATDWEQGAQRQDPLTQTAQIWTGAFWIADLAPPVPTTPQTCEALLTQQLDAQLWLTGTDSPTPELTSEPELSRLAGVARACADASALIITAPDSDLSRSRAEALRAALVARGVAADKITLRFAASPLLGDPTLSFLAPLE